VKEPTTQTGKSVLHLVITSDPDMVKEVNVMGGLGNSDHLIIQWDTKLHQTTYTRKTVNRDYRKADFDEMRRRLQEVEWDTLLNGNVEERWGNFKKCLDAENEFVPLRSTAMRKYKKAVWMTHKAVQSVRRKHNLFRRYRDCNNGHYKDAVRQAWCDTRKARRNFEKKLAENIKEDHKSFYAYIPGRNSVRPTIGPLVGGSGENITSVEDICKEMNRYFSSVFTAEDMSSVPGTQINNKVAQENLGLEEVIIEKRMVTDKLLKMRSDKAMGADNVFPKLLAEIREEIC
jgi:hypothetical protein